MGCLSGIAKYILFLFNFLIFICSILLIIYGALLIQKENLGDDYFDNFSVSQLAIALGALSLIISFFGCFGAIKESSCLLTTYAAILITLFIIQLVLGILAFVAIKDDDFEFKNKTTEYLEKIYNKPSKNEDIIKGIQEDLECCGLNGWKSNFISISQKYCCDEENKCTDANHYDKGCTDAFYDYIVDNSKIIGGIALGFCVVELVGAIFAFCVRNRD